MDQKQVNRNIKSYEFFKIFGMPLFWGPILISYITNIGKMDLSDVYLMESVVVIGMIFMEIYSSGWADLLGRKKTIIIGSAFELAALVLFVFTDSPWIVIAANVIIMIGGAIISGADEAFLADMLKEAGRYDEFTRINQDISSKILAAMAVCSVAAGYLYDIEPHLPIILSVPGVILSFASTFFLTESVRTGKTGHREHFNLIKMSVLFVANHKQVKWIIAFIGLIAVASKIWFFTYNPYFELTELSPKYFGWIFFAFNAIAWGTSRHISLIERKLSEKTIILLMIILMSLPVFLLGTFVSQAAIIFIFCDHVVRGFKGPFFSRLINEHLDSKNRATVLSIQSAAVSVISATGFWAFGIILKHISLPSALQSLGLAGLITGLILFRGYGRIFRQK